MAAQLDERIRTVEQPAQRAGGHPLQHGRGRAGRRRRARIVSSTERGRRACWGSTGRRARGSTSWRSSAHPDLQRVHPARPWRRTEPVEEDIVLTATGERFLQAHGLGWTGSADGGSAPDRAERRDPAAPAGAGAPRFRGQRLPRAARRPITSIKGFVETLLDGAHRRSRRRAARFLDIMPAQADRLKAIIEDLLCLSRIEQEAEQRAMALRDRGRRQRVRAAP